MIGLRKVTNTLAFLSTGLVQAWPGTMNYEPVWKAHFRPF